MWRSSLATVTLAAFAAGLACASERDFVHVDRIRFSGNTVFGEAELAALARPLEGRDLSVAELEELRQRITRFYVDRGYVNSGAVIAEGSLASGILTVTIVEGKLEAVRVHGQERLRESYIASRLDPHAGAPFNIEAMRERFQLLLGDPLFDRLHANVVPGPTPGTAFLDVEVVRALPYEAAIYANNYRPPAIGEYWGGVSARVRNLTTLGDTLDASIEAPIQGGNHEPRGEVAWRAPLGPWQTDVSALWSRGRTSVVEEPARVLDIVSDLTTMEAGIGQKIYEDLRHRVALGFTASRRENVSTLGGERFSFLLGEPEGVTRIRSERFWQEYSYRREAGALVLRSTFARNRNNFEDIAALPAAVETFAKANRTWIGQAYASHEFAEHDAQAWIRTTYQHTTDHLVPLDALALGGVNSVRGFRENQLLRDRGGFVNVDADARVYGNAERQQSLRVGAYLDEGVGWNQGGEHVRIGSIGAALRARWRRLRADLYVALHRWRGDAVPHTSGALQDHGVHFQLTWSIF